MTRMMRDLDLLNLMQRLLRQGIIEQRSNRQTHVISACPCQILHHQRTWCRDGGINGVKGLLRVRPVAAIKDKTIDHRVKTLFKNGRKVTLPPKNQRQVTGEMSKNRIAESTTRNASEREGNLLAADRFFPAAQMAMGGDPCSDRGVLCGAVHLNQHRAAGMLAGQFADNLGILRKRTRCFRVDSEIDQTSIRARIILLPQLAQGFVNAADGHFLTELRVHRDCLHNGSFRCDANDCHRHAEDHRPPSDPMSRQRIRPSGWARHFDAKPVQCHR